MGMSCATHPGKQEKKMIAFFLFLFPKTKAQEV